MGLKLFLEVRCGDVRTATGGTAARRGDIAAPLELSCMALSFVSRLQTPVLSQCNVSSHSESAHECSVTAA